MTKPKPIYVVTTIRGIDPESRQFHSRAVGWFGSLTDAVNCVTQNWGDIYELGYYPMAVVEETHEGLYPHIADEYWFRWDAGARPPGYVAINKPETMSNVVNFGLG